MFLFCHFHLNAHVKEERHKCYASVQNSELTPSCCWEGWGGENLTNLMEAKPVRVDEVGLPQSYRVRN